MNALEKLMADISRAHGGAAGKPAAATRKAQPRQKPAPRPVAAATNPADASPAIARALAVLRSAMRGAQ